MKEYMGTPDELFELLGAAWDGTLDEESFERLEALLASDTETSCDSLVAFSRMQVELAWSAASSQAHEKALARLKPLLDQRSLAAPSASKAGITEGPHFLPVAFGGRFAISRQRCFAIAAALLVALGAVVWQTVNHQRSPDAADEIAVVANAHRMVARVASTSKDASWKHAHLLVPGDLLPGGQRLELLEGSAQISMACGADLLLQSPCTVELTSEKAVRLVSGIVTAQVADWGKGFIVNGSGVTLTDLGTRFAAQVDAEGNCQAHVFEGLVSAKSSLASVDEKSIFVKAEQAVEWDEAQSTLRSIPVDHGSFKEAMEEFRPLRTIDVANTGRRLAAGAQDPRWQITAGHASGGRFPIQAVVSRAAAGHFESGLTQSQWISVRGGTTRGVEQYTQYTFATDFDLSGVDPATVQLIGYVVVDNRVQEIRLNGKPVNLQPWQTINGGDFSKPHVVTIRQGFVRGANRLEIDVINGTIQNGSTHNPMGLRAEWQAFGCATGG